MNKIDLDELPFERPDLGTTEIITNLGRLILYNPCAYDLYRLQEISQQREGLDRFFFFAELIGATLDGKPVLVHNLMLLDPESFQKIVSYFTEMMLSLVPKLTPEAQQILDTL